MSITHNSDRKSTALALQVDYFKDKANWGKLLQSYAVEFQAIEDMWSALQTQRDIDNGSGEQLDVIGRIVGQPRAGFADPAYRLRLKARILLNKCSGTIEEIYAIFVLLTAGANTFWLEQVFPASLVLHILEPTTPDITDLAAILQQAKDAGVGAQLHYITTSAATTFTCSDSALGLVASTALGFADSSAPGTGGHLAGSA
jgi:Protein of unknown function (DUF2612)